ncbi:MAG: DsbA family protein [Nitrospirota bacterium]|nr:MAG: DsbA family protein [Nitrospirota bacterium]
MLSLLVLAASLLMGSFSFGQTTDLLLRSNDEVRGDANAPVTLLEYSDFTCGYCEKFFHETFPRLLTRYIDTGKVRFVYRDFPRSPSGPALHSALAARCAGDQQAYWPMHDRLFNSGRKFDMFTLQEIAKDLDLDLDDFSECLESQRHLEDIYQDRLEGGQLGIRGTPGFILFLTDLSQGSEALFIPGAFPFEVFEEEIEKLLEKAQQNGSQPPSHASPQVEGL